MEQNRRQSTSSAASSTTTPENQSKRKTLKRKSKVSHTHTHTLCFFLYNDYRMPQPRHQIPTNNNHSRRHNRNRNRNHHHRPLQIALEKAQEVAKKLALNTLKAGTRSSPDAINACLSSQQLRCTAILPDDRQILWQGLAAATYVDGQQITYIDYLTAPIAVDEDKVEYEGNNNNENAFNILLLPFAFFCLNFPHA